MKHSLCALALLVCPACTQDTVPSAGNITGPSSLTSVSTTSAAVSVPRNYRAHLSGDQVVPPRETLAQGEAIFQLSPDGTELSFKVIASNIQNVTGAHIHLGAVGVPGPNVALLSPPLLPAGGREDGVLAGGTITAADLRPPLAGQPLSALIDAIEAGNAYVDVPTNDGEAPGATGPGDFPLGEIRGQIR